MENQLSLKLQQRTREPFQACDSICGLLGDAHGANRRFQQVVVQASCTQGMRKGFLVPLAHEVAEELIV